MVLKPQQARGCFFATDGIRDYSSKNNTLTNANIPQSGGLYDFATPTKSVDLLYKSDPVGMPTGAADPFTIVCVIKPRSYVSLAGVFGFSARSVISVNPSNGQGRILIHFNNNYYFWGSGVDWDTGIQFDTDNCQHIVAIAASSTNIYFWRDGVQRASAARPSLQNITTGTEYIEVGNAHSSAATGPDMLWGGGALFNRELTPSELASITTDYYNHLFKPAGGAW